MNQHPTDAFVGKRAHYDMEPSLFPLEWDHHHTCKRPRRFSTPDSATSTITEDRDSSGSPPEPCLQHNAHPTHIYQPHVQYERYTIPTRPVPANVPVAPDPPVYSPPPSVSDTEAHIATHSPVFSPAPQHPVYCVDRTPEYTRQSTPAYSPSSSESPAQQALRPDEEVEADVINSFSTGETGTIGWTNEMLISVLTTDIEDLCYVNEDNSDHAISPDHKIFFSQYRQPFELEFYIRRLVQYSNCSASAFVTMLVYLDRVQERCKSLSMSEMNCHRLLCTALVLAIKYLDDEVYSNAYYARVGGLSTEELNTLESTMLNVLGWNLTVCPETYSMYEDSLIQSASLLNLEIGSPAME